MGTPAYVLGVVDALVKAGELSPAYAAGVSSVLRKHAGLFWDTSHEDTAKAMSEWQNAHPGEQMPASVAQAIYDKQGHNWYDNFTSNNGAGWGYTLKNKWGKMLSHTWWGTNGMTPDMYDAELRAKKNEGALARQKEWESQGKYLSPMASGALQDARMRDARTVMNNAHARGMSAFDREQAGLTDDYVDKFRTQSGDAAATSGTYDPKYFRVDKQEAPKGPAYGYGLPKQFGANKNLVYKRDFYDPTET